MADEESDILGSLEKKAFTNWINIVLKDHTPQYVVTDIFKDLRSGEVILALIEKLTGQKLQYATGNYLKIMEYIDNIELAIRVLEKNGVNLGKVQAYDIFKGNHDVILSLLWNIILIFEIKIKEPKVWEELLVKRDFYNKMRNTSENNSNQPIASQIPDFPLKNFSLGFPKQVLQDWCLKYCNMIDVDAYNFSRSRQEEILLLSNLINFIEEELKKSCSITSHLGSSTKDIRDEEINKDKIMLTKSSENLSKLGLQFSAPLGPFIKNQKVDLERAQWVYDMVGRRLGISLINFDLLKERYDESALVHFLIHFFQGYINSDTSALQSPLGENKKRDVSPNDLGKLIANLKKGICNIVNQVDSSIPYLAQQEFLIWSKVLTQNSFLNDKMRDIYDRDTTDSKQIGDEIWNNIEKHWMSLDDIKTKITKKLNEVLFKDIYDLYVMTKDKYSRDGPTLTSYRSTENLSIDKDIIKKQEYLSAINKLKEPHLKSPAGSFSFLNKLATSHNLSNDDFAITDAESIIRIDFKKLSHIYQYLLIVAKVKATLNVFNKVLDRSMGIGSFSKNSSTDIIEPDTNLNDNLNALLKNLKSLVKDHDQILLNSSNYTDPLWSEDIVVMEHSIDDIQIINDAWDVYKRDSKLAGQWLNNINNSNEPIKLSDIKSHEFLFDGLDRYGSILTSNCSKKSSPRLHSNFNDIMGRWINLKKAFEKYRDMEDKYWEEKSESTKLLGTVTADDTRNYTDTYIDPGTGQEISIKGQSSKKFEESLKDKEVLITKINERVVFKPVLKNPDDNLHEDPEDFINKKVFKSLYDSLVVPHLDKFKIGSSAPDLSQYLLLIQEFQKESLTKLQELKNKINKPENADLRSLIDNKTNLLRSNIKIFEQLPLSRAKDIDEKLKKWSYFMNIENLADTDPQDLQELADSYKDMIHTVALPYGDFLNQCTELYNNSNVIYPHNEVDFTYMKDRLQAMHDIYDKNVKKSNEYNDSLKQMIPLLAHYYFDCECVYKYIAQVKEILASNLKESHVNLKKFTIKLDDNILTDLESNSRNLIFILPSDHQKSAIKHKTDKIERDWELCKFEIILITLVNSFKVHEDRLDKILQKFRYELNYEQESFQSGKFEISSILERYKTSFPPSTTQLIDEDLSKMNTTKNEIATLVNSPRYLQNLKDIDLFNQTFIPNSLSIILGKSSIFETLNSHDKTFQLNSIPVSLDKLLTEKTDLWHMTKELIEKFGRSLQSAHSEREKYLSLLTIINDRSKAMGIQVNKLLETLKQTGLSKGSTNESKQDHQLSEIRNQKHKLGDLIVKLEELDMIINGGTYSSIVPDPISAIDRRHFQVLNNNLLELGDFLNALENNYLELRSISSTSSGFSRHNTEQESPLLQGNFDKIPLNSPMISQSQHEIGNEEVNVNVHKRVKIDLPTFDLSDLKVRSIQNTPQAQTTPNRLDTNISIIHRENTDKIGLDDEPRFDKLSKMEFRDQVKKKVPVEDLNDDDKNKDATKILKRADFSVKFSDIGDVHSNVVELNSQKRLKENQTLPSQTTQLPSNESIVSKAKLDKPDALHPITQLSTDKISTFELPHSDKPIQDDKPSLSLNSNFNMKAKTADTIEKFTSMTHEFTNAPNVKSSKEYEQLFLPDIRVWAGATQEDLDKIEQIKPNTRIFQKEATPTFQTEMPINIELKHDHNGRKYAKNIEEIVVKKPEPSISPTDLVNADILTKNLNNEKKILLNNKEHMTVHGLKVDNQPQNSSNINNSVSNLLCLKETLPLVVNSDANKLRENVSISVSPIVGLDKNLAFDNLPKTNVAQNHTGLDIYKAPLVDEKGRQLPLPNISSDQNIFKPSTKLHGPKTDDAIIKLPKEISIKNDVFLGQPIENKMNQDNQKPVVDKEKFRDRGVLKEKKELEAKITPNILMTEEEDSNKDHIKKDLAGKPIDISRVESGGTLKKEDNALNTILHSAGLINYPSKEVVSDPLHKQPKEDRSTSKEPDFKGNQSYPEMGEPTSREPKQTDNIQNDSPIDEQHKKSEGSTLSQAGKPVLEGIQGSPETGIIEQSNLDQPSPILNMKSEEEPNVTKEDPFVIYYHQYGETHNPVSTELKEDVNKIPEETIMTDYGTYTNEEQEPVPLEDVIPEDGDKNLTINFENSSPLSVDEDKRKKRLGLESGPDYKVVYLVETKDIKGKEDLEVESVDHDDVNFENIKYNQPIIENDSKIKKLDNVDKGKRGVDEAISTKSIKPSNDDIPPNQIYSETSPGEESQPRIDVSKVEQVDDDHYPITNYNVKKADSLIKSPNQIINDGDNGVIRDYKSIDNYSENLTSHILPHSAQLNQDSGKIINQGGIQKSIDNISLRSQNDDNIILAEVNRNVKIEKNHVHDTPTVSSDLGIDKNEDEVKSLDDILKQKKEPDAEIADSNILITDKSDSNIDGIKKDLIGKPIDTSIDDKSRVELGGTLKKEDNVLNNILLSAGLINESKKTVSDLIHKQPKEDRPISLEPGFKDTQPDQEMRETTTGEIEKTNDTQNDRHMDKQNKKVKDSLTSDQKGKTVLDDRQGSPEQESIEQAAFNKPSSILRGSEEESKNKADPFGIYYYQYGETHNPVSTEPQEDVNKIPKESIMTDYGTYTNEEQDPTPLEDVIPEDGDKNLTINFENSSPLNVDEDKRKKRLGLESGPDYKVVSLVETKDIKGKEDVEVESVDHDDVNFENIKYNQPIIENDIKIKKLDNVDKGKRGVDEAISTKSIKPSNDDIPPNQIYSDTSPGEESQPRIDVSKVEQVDDHHHPITNYNVKNADSVIKSPNQIINDGDNEVIRDYKSIDNYSENLTSHILPHSAQLNQEFGKIINQDKRENIEPMSHKTQNEDNIVVKDKSKQRKEHSAEMAHPDISIADKGDSNIDHIKNDLVEKPIDTQIDNKSRLELGGTLKKEDNVLNNILLSAGLINQSKNTVSDLIHKQPKEDRPLSLEPDVKDTQSDQKTKEATYGEIKQTNNNTHKDSDIDQKNKKIEDSFTTGQAGNGVLDVMLGSPEKEIIEPSAFDQPSPIHKIKYTEELFQKRVNIDVMPLKSMSDDLPLIEDNRNVEIEKHYIPETPKFEEVEILNISYPEPNKSELYHKTFKHDVHRDHKNDIDKNINQVPYALYKTEDKAIKEHENSILENKKKLMLGKEEQPHWQLNAPSSHLGPSDLENKQDVTIPITTTDFILTKDNRNAKLKKHHISKTPTIEKVDKSLKKNINPQLNKGEPFHNAAKHDGHEDHKSYAHENINQVPYDPLKVNDKKKELKSTKKHGKAIHEDKKSLSIEKSKISQAPSKFEKNTEDEFVNIIHSEKLIPSGKTVHNQHLDRKLDALKQLTDEHRLSNTEIDKNHSVNVSAIKINDDLKHPQSSEIPRDVSNRDRHTGNVITGKSSHSTSNNTSSKGFRIYKERSTDNQYEEQPHWQLNAPSSHLEPSHSEFKQEVTIPKTTTDVILTRDNRNVKFIKHHVPNTLTLEEVEKSLKKSSCLQPNKSEPSHNAPKHDGHENNNQVSYDLPKVKDKKKEYRGSKEHEKTSHEDKKFLIAEKSKITHPPFKNAKNTEDELVNIRHSEKRADILKVDNQHPDLKSGVFKQSTENIKPNVSNTEIKYGDQGLNKVDNSFDKTIRRKSSTYKLDDTQKIYVLEENDSEDNIESYSTLKYPETLATSYNDAQSLQTDKHGGKNMPQNDKIIYSDHPHKDVKKTNSAQIHEKLFTDEHKKESHSKVTMNIPVNEANDSSTFNATLLTNTNADHTLPKLDKELYYDNKPIPPELDGMPLSIIIEQLDDKKGRHYISPYNEDASLDSLSYEGGDESVDLMHKDDRNHKLNRKIPVITEKEHDKTGPHHNISHVTNEKQYHPDHTTPDHAPTLIQPRSHDKIKYDDKPDISIQGFKQPPTLDKIDDFIPDRVMVKRHQVPYDKTHNDTLIASNIWPNLRDEIGVPPKDSKIPFIQMGERTTHFKPSVNKHKNHFNNRHHAHKENESGILKSVGSDFTDYLDYNDADYKVEQYNKSEIDKDLNKLHDSSSFNKNSKSSNDQKEANLHLQFVNPFSKNKTEKVIDTFDQNSNIIPKEKVKSQRNKKRSQKNQKTVPENIHSLPDNVISSEDVVSSSEEEPIIVPGSSKYGAQNFKIPNYSSIKQTPSIDKTRKMNTENVADNIEKAPININSTVEKVNKTSHVPLTNILDNTAHAKPVRVSKKSKIPHLSHKIDHVSKENTSLPVKIKTFLDESSLKDTLKILESHKSDHKMVGVPQSHNEKILSDSFEVYLDNKYHENKPIYLHNQVSENIINQDIPENIDAMPLKPTNDDLLLGKDNRNVKIEKHHISETPTVEDVETSLKKSSYPDPNKGEPSHTVSKHHKDHEDYVHENIYQIPYDIPKVKDKNRQDKATKRHEKAIHEDELKESLIIEKNKILHEEAKRIEDEIVDIKHYKKRNDSFGFVDNNQHFDLNLGAFKASLGDIKHEVSNTKSKYVKEKDDKTQSYTNFLYNPLHIKRDQRNLHASEYSDDLLKNGQVYEVNERLSKQEQPHLQSNTFNIEFNENVNNQLSSNDSDSILLEKDNRNTKIENRIHIPETPTVEEIEIYLKEESRHSKPNKNEPLHETLKHGGHKDHINYVYENINQVPYDLPKVKDKKKGDKATKRHEKAILHDQQHKKLVNNNTPFKDPADIESFNKSSTKSKTTASSHHDQSDDKIFDYLGKVTKDILYQAQHHAHFPDYSINKKEKLHMKEKTPNQEHHRNTKKSNEPNSTIFQSIESKQPLHEDTKHDSTHYLTNDQNGELQSNGFQADKGRFRYYKHVEQQPHLQSNIIPSSKLETTYSEFNEDATIPLNNIGNAFILAKDDRNTRIERHHIPETLTVEEVETSLKKSSYPEPNKLSHTVSKHHKDYVHENIYQISYDIPKAKDKKKPDKATKRHEKAILEDELKESLISEKKILHENAKKNEDEIVDIKHKKRNDSPNNINNNQHIDLNLGAFKHSIQDIKPKVFNTKSKYDIELKYEKTQNSTNPAYNTLHIEGDPRHLHAYKYSDDLHMDEQVDEVYEELSKQEQPHLQPEFNENVDKQLPAYDSLLLIKDNRNTKIKNRIHIPETPTVEEIEISLKESSYSKPNKNEPFHNAHKHGAHKDNKNYAYENINQLPYDLPKVKQKKREDKATKRHEKAQQHKELVNNNTSLKDTADIENYNKESAKSRTTFGSHHDPSNEKIFDYLSKVTKDILYQAKHHAHFPDYSINKKEKLNMREKDINEEHHKDAKSYNKPNATIYQSNEPKHLVLEDIKQDFKDSNYSEYPHDRMNDTHGELQSDAFEVYEGRSNRHDHHQQHFNSLTKPNKVYDSDFYNNDTFPITLDDESLLLIKDDRNTKVIKHEVTETPTTDMAGTDPTKHLSDKATHGTTKNTIKDVKNYMYENINQLPYDLTHTKDKKKEDKATQRHEKIILDNEHKKSHDKTMKSHESILDYPHKNLTTPRSKAEKEILIQFGPYDKDSTHQTINKKAYKDERQTHKLDNDKIHLDNESQHEIKPRESQYLRQSDLFIDKSTPNIAVHRFPPLQVRIYSGTKNVVDTHLDKSNQSDADVRGEHNKMFDDLSRLVLDEDDKFNDKKSKSDDKFTSPLNQTYPIKEKADHFMPHLEVDIDKVHNIQTPNMKPLVFEIDSSDNDRVKNSIKFHKLDNLPNDVKPNIDQTQSEPFNDKNYEPTSILLHNQSQVSDKEKIIQNHQERTKNLFSNIDYSKATRDLNDLSNVNLQDINIKLKNILKTPRSVNDDPNVRQEIKRLIHLSKTLMSPKNDHTNERDLENELPASAKKLKDVIHLHENANKIQALLPKGANDQDLSLAQSLVEIRDQSNALIPALKNELEGIKDINVKLSNLQSALKMGEQIIDFISDGESGDSKLPTAIGLKEIETNFKKIADPKDIHKIKDQIGALISDLKPRVSAITQQNEILLKDFYDSNIKLRQLSKGKDHAKVYNQELEQEFDAKYVDAKQRANRVKETLNQKLEQLSKIDDNLNAIISFFEQFYSHNQEIEDWIGTAEKVLEDPDKSTKEKISLLPKLQRENISYQTLMDDSEHACDRVLDHNTKMFDNVKLDITSMKGKLGEVEKKILNTIGHQTRLNNLENDVTKDLKKIEKSLKNCQDLGVKNKLSNLYQSLMINKPQFGKEDIARLNTFLDIYKKIICELEPSKLLLIGIHKKLEDGGAKPGDIKNLRQAVDGITNDAKAFYQKGQDVITSLSDKLLGGYKKEKMDITLKLKTFDDNLNNLEDQSNIPDPTIDSERLQSPLKELEALKTRVDEIYSIYLNTPALSRLQDYHDKLTLDPKSSSNVSQVSIETPTEINSISERLIPEIKHDITIIRDKVATISNRYKNLQSKLDLTLKNTKNYGGKLTRLENDLIKEAQKFSNIDKGFDYDSLNDKLNAGLRPALENYVVTYIPIFNELECLALSLPSPKPDSTNYEEIVNPLAKVKNLKDTYYEPTIKWVESRLEGEKGLAEKADLLFSEVKLLLDTNGRDMKPFRELVIALKHLLAPKQGKDDLDSFELLPQNIKPSRPLIPDNQGNIVQLSQSPSKRTIKGGEMVFQIDHDSATDSDFETERRRRSSGADSGLSSPMDIAPTGNFAFPSRLNSKLVPFLKAGKQFNDISLEDVLKYITNIQNEYWVLARPLIDTLQRFSGNLSCHENVNMQDLSDRNKVEVNTKFERILNAYPQNDKDAKMGEYDKNIKVGIIGIKPEADSAAKKMNVHPSVLCVIKELDDYSYRLKQAFSDMNSDTQEYLDLIKILIDKKLAKIEKSLLSAKHDQHFVAYTQKAVFEPIQIKTLDNLMNYRAKILLENEDTIFAENLLDKMENQITEVPPLHGIYDDRIANLRKIIQSHLNYFEKRLKDTELTVTRYKDNHKRVEAFKNDAKDILIGQKKLKPISSNLDSLKALKAHAEKLISDMEDINNDDYFFTNEAKDQQPLSIKLEQYQTLAQQYAQLRKLLDNALSNIETKIKGIEKSTQSRDSPDKSFISSSGASSQPLSSPNSPLTFPSSLPSIINPTMIDKISTQLSPFSIQHKFPFVSHDEPSVDTYDNKQPQHNIPQGESHLLKPLKNRLFDKLKFTPLIEKYGSSKAKSQNMGNLYNNFDDLFHSETKTDPDLHSLPSISPKTLSDSNELNELDLSRLSLKLMDTADSTLSLVRLAFQKALESSALQKKEDQDFLKFHKTLSSSNSNANTSSFDVESAKESLSQLISLSKNIVAVRDVLETPDLYLKRFRIKMPRDVDNLKRNLARKYDIIVKTIGERLKDLDILGLSKKDFENNDISDDSPPASPFQELFQTLANLKNKYLLPSETEISNTESNEYKNVLSKINGHSLIWSLLHNVGRNRSALDNLENPSDNITNSGTSSFTWPNIFRSDNIDASSSQDTPRENNNDRNRRQIIRILKASIPLQILLLSILGFACLLPLSKTDYNCLGQNNFLSSMNPSLNYPNGAPPL
ncbi:uncharacterized protein LOC135928744 [Gordionus sp. m RMFG-2023]|uniref:uncharacterized protein LOC135928744 n=1 Tax=Gordionus sp. m RMFG-2023 TaxID=3053472 RepID=UPI0031FE33FE